jgi:hypothetical protein
MSPGCATGSRKGAIENAPGITIVVKGLKISFFRVDEMSI